MNVIKVKRWVAILTTAVLCGTAAAQDGANTAAREALIARLATMQQTGLAYGHQDDTFYGVNWCWQEGRSDVREVCGDYPAVMGFELGGIELAQPCNLDSVPFDMMRRELLAHTSRGGVATISWHPHNPLTGGNAWDVSDSTVVKSVLPGGSRHRLFLTWMDRLADFLLTISADGSTAVSFIFRPWHENNGSWFWWGRDLCSAEEYRALWCMTQDYLLHRGLTNVVWAYSPNLEGGMTFASFLQRYPGDDRVDLIGLDAYQWGTREDFVGDATANLQLLSTVAGERGKLFALTECGLQSVPDATWWTQTLLPLVTAQPMAYFLTWRNGDRKERYAPYTGSNDEEDFRRFAADKCIMFLKDITKKR